MVNYSVQKREEAVIELASSLNGATKFVFEVVS